ncbi:conserved exported hypothetical protein [Rhodococcus sp. RD6.2]|uniref:hypothetical protein n=1 Tax=Rhodococcus sp. RD6.2 TaxID=260936 RepID=UPI00063B51AC|nr:hypothetical protein [Rhodococcus sp. RD6.2]CRK49690.1 conserved exported hypothetical protein [Rhodococcus sp. RD6.2]
MKLVGKLGVCAATLTLSGLCATGLAAATTIPFQLDPAPFSNPNGSFDAPSVRCVAEVGDQPGDMTITGGKPGGWGCLLSSQVRWVNLSTGASGSARLSDGLNGIPAAATVHTGTGQVAVLLDPATPGPITPGLATFFVP